MEYYKDRFLLPVFIPLGAIALIGVVAFSMSRVLLNVPKIVATSVALMIALNLLAVCAYLAVRPGFQLSQAGPLLAVVLVPLVAGGVVAAGAFGIEGEEGHAEKTAPAVPVVAISAKNLAFDVTELKVPADETFKISFTNGDTAPHNVTILKAKGSVGSDVLFKKPFFEGPKTEKWTVSPIPAGTYYFQCDVHPNMNGQVTAA